MPIQYTLISMTVKLIIFSGKKIVTFFLFLLHIIDCGYTLEPSIHKSMIKRKNMKIKHTLVKPLVLLYEPRHEKTGFLFPAQLISAFVFAIRIVQSLYYLNPKFQVSSHFLWL